MSIIPILRIVREHGGLVIADEVQSGLGRMGNNMWAFMDYGLVPDIVTIGKGLGNGFPMGAVICSREVSDRLGGYFSTFGGNPVACAIGQHNDWCPRNASNVFVGHLYMARVEGLKC